MAIEFTCKKCGKTLRVNVSLAGRKAKCPKCGSVDRIPETTTAFDVLPDFSEPDSAPIAAKKEKRSAPRQPRTEKRAAPKTEKKPQREKQAKAVSKRTSASSTKKQPSRQPAMVQPETVDSRPQQQLSGASGFYVTTDFGRTYGPVPQSELDEWVQEGRVTSDYVIRRQGDSKGVFASAMYPELGPISEAVAAKPMPLPVQSGHGNAAVRSTAVVAAPHELTLPPISTAVPDVNFIVQHAWDICRKHYWTLFFAGLFAALPSFAIGAYNGLFVDPDDPPNAAFLSMISFAAFFVGQLLWLGIAKLCLRLGRGQQAGFATVFTGGSRLFPHLLHLFMFTVAIAVGMVFLVVPGIFIYAIFWPSIYLVIDRRSGPGTSFLAAYPIGLENVLTSAILFALSGGLVVFGALGCGIGILFTLPLLNMLWAVAYLTMANQIPSRRAKKLKASSI